MIKRQNLNHGIPIATSLQPILEAEHIAGNKSIEKRRILVVTGIAILIAMLVSLVARVLISLINLATNISFYGHLSLEATSPAHHSLGLFVIVLPALGGIVIGLMALYGSRAIRGHGIPEAMEQILTNDSKIRPAIAYLKPLSSAIAIGTGGPFGAEGPIIATGGALGSTIGQLLKISHYERKVLLAAGATAGMSAIFGTPIAAIFLAIELLLFEFSPSSIIPVALACITGAAGHHLLFEAESAFPVGHVIEAASNSALLVYCVLGVLLGLLSVLVTRIVYKIEDLFELLPIHWMWWPAIGGLVVGIVGYFYPRTLGVGYDNISDVLTGSLPVQMVLSLFVFKFISWAVALGSGTSGGTLAPLLTIGGAAGALLGIVAQRLFPGAGVSVSLAALVGMAATFAGASRAVLTSIIFAVETTGQANALLPLLAACTTAYAISLYLMENTIMTEKIARRGVKTPASYRPDVLEQYTVSSVMNSEGLIISEDNTIGEVREWIKDKTTFHANYYVIVNNTGGFSGIISSSNLFSEQHNALNTVGTLIKRKTAPLQPDTMLKTAVELMVNENLDLLPVVDDSQAVIGMLSYRDVLGAYKLSQAKHIRAKPVISVKRKTLKLLAKSQQIMSARTR
jgi:CIC family chloride channel protein